MENGESDCGERRGYYGGLERPEDPARASGWKRRIGQYARFEMALAPWDGSGFGSILDLGCGTGELAGYLEATGRAVDYCGIDTRESAIEEARRRHPEGEFVCADLHEVEPGRSYEFAVAVGAQVDGDAPESEGDRVERVRRLVRRCAELGVEGFSCVVLDQAHARERPMIREEPALFGVTREELGEIEADEEGRSRIVGEMLRTDLALVAALGERTDRPARFDSEIALERATRIDRREGGSRLDEAWMWLEANRPDRAREVLERAEGGGSRYRLLVDRVRRQSNGG